MRTIIHRHRRTSFELVFLSALVLVTGALPRPSLAQETQGRPVDLETLEAQYNERFAAALEVPESEAVAYLQAWTLVLDSAMMIERRRLMEEGGGRAPGRIDPAVVRERVFDQWRRARPGTVGPDLLRATRIEDPAHKKAAVLALLDRHPDELIVARQAWWELRQSGETARATELLESFLARNPESTSVYRLLAADARGNATRQAEILERWNRASPGDPELVVSWLWSRRIEPDPATLAPVLSAFFAREPKGEDGLSACLAVYRSGAGEFADEARGCVARLAVDPDSRPEVAKRAQAALASLAAEEGDWSGFLAAIDGLEPQARWSALLGTASALEAPARCDERIDLLKTARTALPDDDALRALAGALLRCAEVPAARTLFLSLLEQAPAERLVGIVRSWTTRVNERLQGELPEQTAKLLERRLETEADPTVLFEALDLVYEVSGTADQRFDLLRRWYERSPMSFNADQTTAFAEQLWMRGQRDAAVEALERLSETHWQPSVAELLWSFYVESDQPGRAERLVGKLIGNDDPWRLQTGHRLAARTAAMHNDLALAEEHYWETLQGDLPQQEDAVEMLSAVGSTEDPAGVQSMAVRICEETPLGAGRSTVAECAAGLLQQAGYSEAATDVLDVADLPDEPSSLYELARAAQSAGRTEAAERAYRRILEIDPRNPGSWSSLGAFLEKQGRVGELQELLDRAGNQFPSLPVELYRAAGRALTAAGKPRAAIDALLEARESLPDGAGGDWSRGWINHELRDAYRALGSQLPVEPNGQAQEASPTFRMTDRQMSSDATSDELRAAADALYSGSGGRYDPITAAELYWRAASKGDFLAEFRLALLVHLDASGVPAEAPGASALYRRSIEQVRALAAQGDSYAQYLLGTALLVGLGVPADPAAARPWLERAAAGGESWAWHNLGWMKQGGHGFPTANPDAAREAYRRASQAGNARSMLDFANGALTSDASGALCEEGLRWLQRSAQTGHAGAAKFLGEVLFFGRGDCVARAPEASIEWLEASATAHQPRANYYLGLALLLTGEGKELGRALELLQASAESADVLAVETLALVHASGAFGVRRDPAEAHRYLAEAARLGSDGLQKLRQSQDQQVYEELIHRGLQRLEGLAEKQDASARAFLSRLYFLGLGGPVDPQRTVLLARLAAAEGEALAMRTLSQLYQRGEGVESNEAEALKWQGKCAQAGDSFCMMFHAHALMEGKGSERDLKAGLEWLERAAEAGNWWATADMGRLHDEGWHGLPRNPEVAAVWKQHLAGLGDPEARGWLAYYGYDSQ